MYMYMYSIIRKPINANVRVRFFGQSKNGFVISDHSDHAASKEPTNPCPEWIHLKKLHITRQITTSVETAEM